MEHIKDIIQRAHPELMSKELVSQPASIDLVIGTNAVEKASGIATHLAKVIEDRKLYSVIDGRKYVIVEGWTTLGAMLGVFPRVIKTENLSGTEVDRVLVSISKKYYDKNRGWQVREKKSYVDPSLWDESMKIIPGVGGTQSRKVKEVKYHATVGIYHKGELITTGEAICTNLEGDKIQNPEYAILSMAQTRATGKAFRLALSWIMQMAGYEVTPYEEMTDIPGKEEAEVVPPKPVTSSNGSPTAPSAHVGQAVIDEAAKRSEGLTPEQKQKAVERATVAGDMSDENIASLTKALGI